MPEKPATIVFLYEQAAERRLGVRHRTQGVIARSCVHNHEEGFRGRRRIL